MSIRTLQVEHLKIWQAREGHVLVPDSSFTLKQGRCLAIVGESGSGKSLTCRAIMRLNQSPLSQSGKVILNGINLSELSDKEMRKFRGKRLCMIMQNGMRAFDPSQPVGKYLLRVLTLHYDWSRSEALVKLTSALANVGLGQPAEVLRSYPFQLSGGMLQRVMIALAIVLEPDVVIADEPTTALDAVTQYEVVEQFVQLRNRLGSMMIFVSHDLAVVKRIADEVVVMKDGAIVEQDTARQIFTEARHPYTRYLVSSKQVLRRHFTNVMGGVELAEN